MNKETYDFFGCEVSFNEKALRKVLASQLDNSSYVKGKKILIDMIYDKSLDYSVRQDALNRLFSHLQNQNVVMLSNSGMTTSQMLKVMRAVLN